MSTAWRKEWLTFIMLITTVMSEGSGNYRRLLSYNFPSYNIGFNANGVASITTTQESFRIVSPGLMGIPSTVSFESVRFPGRYLRHRDYILHLDPFTEGNQLLFKKDATFYPRHGRYFKGYTSYESYNFPGYFIRHQNSVLRISASGNNPTELFKKDASFRESKVPDSSSSCTTIGELKQDSDCGGDYYICDHGGWTKMSCPAGLKFSEAANQCDWDYNVAGCNSDAAETTTTTAATTTTTEADSSTSCTTSGELKQVSDCGGDYYICDHGEWTQMSCPAGLKFSEAANQCDWDYNVAGCNTDAVETTTTIIATTTTTTEGSWSDWTTWSACDKPCGSGQQSRTRTCLGPGQCAGESQQLRQCNAQACNTGWSACSVTCGDGISKKLDPVTGLYSTVHCNGPDCAIPASCPSGEERRFKVPHECCKKTSATSKWCDRPTAVSSYNFVRRIIGGDNSVRGDFPWMVFFSGMGTCGGAMISKKHILTAAHCIRTDSGGRKDPTIVYAGMADLGDTANRKQLKVASSFAHPQYQFPKNDIAILELEAEIQYNLYMRPLCLPHGEKPSYDTTCIAMGWGISVNGVRAVTNVLQNVDIKVLDLDVCIHGYLNSKSTSLRDLGATLQTRPAMLCAGDLKNEKDSCSGDSGSPLVCQRCNSCGWFVAGVVSFGPTPCAMKGVPGVYTDVVGYEDWIYATTGVTKETRGC